MKRSIIIRSVLTTMAALVLFAVVSIVLIDYYNRDATEKELHRIMTMAETELTGSNDPESTAKLGTPVWDIRITVIATDGSVLAESNPPEGDSEGMENHLDREEVRAALSGKDTVIARMSPTLGIKMYYYAKKVSIEPEGVKQDVVLRVSIPVSRINDFVTGIIVTMVILVVAVGALSILMAQGLHRRVLQPYNLIKKGLRNINNGTYTEIVPRFRDNDLNETLSEINNFSERISATLAENAREKEKLNYILNNMGQGLVVLNAAHTVLLVNRNAAGVFGLTEDVTGCNALYLTREAVFLQAADKAIANRVSTVFDYESEENVYAVTVEPLLSAWAGDSREYVAVITMRNVTEVRSAERVRSEFFANASHELKTPLTSVMGFAELLDHNMVKDPNKIKQYTGRIVEHSDRMLHLIDDMLMLSHLDEGAGCGEIAEVDLPEVAEEVIKGLAVQAEVAKVTLHLRADPVTVTAAREDMVELVTNLAGNAIKYNVRGGEVRVAVYRENGRATLAVEDTGIGIPQEHQQRIFERFYRVDKGRSRAHGGTGLGLAIVKHICARYNAEITLKSEPGAGTDIRVKF